MGLNGRVMSQGTLVFLFLNVLAALLLHVGRLPVWLIAFSLMALTWRLSMFSGRVPNPNWLAKLVLVISGFSGVYVTYGANLTIEAMVSLLIAGVMLKPLEVSQQKDSYLLIFLNYFLCALLFLFDRTPLDFILVLVVMVFTLGAQVLVHFYDEPNRKQSLKVGFGLLLKSLPLAIVLFFVLPRLGPLWTLTIPTQSGVVGLSDSMSPGSIAQLGENDDLAFRVKLLEGELPMSQRYWRAFSLSVFDGETWQQGNHYQSSGAIEFYDESKPSIQYEIMVEPHEKKWLFALGAAKPLTQGISVQPDAVLQRKRPLYDQWQYQVSSNTSAVIPASISPFQRRIYTRLPQDSNPQARQFAQQLSQQTNDLNQWLALVQGYMDTQQFSYTLSPGEFDGDDQIDHFLFESRTGFCSYYAGALTFLLRAADIPARVVLGYMGGEDNAISNTLSVYQYDAHAWVEVFVEGQGWFRIDPTAWVAPDRVESGLQRAIPNEFKGFNSQSLWLIELRKQWQAFDYVWNNWMLSYKGNQQQAFLKSVWGEKTAQELAFLLLGAFFVLGFGLFAFLWWDQRSKPISYEQKIFLVLYGWLTGEKNNKALRPELGVTFKQIFTRLQQKYPYLSASLNGLNQELNKGLYQPQGAALNKNQAQRIMKLIRILKKQTKQ